MEKNPLFSVEFHGKQTTNMVGTHRFLLTNFFSITFSVPLNLFHQSICLGVVWGGPDSLDMTQMGDFLHHGMHEIGALICQDLIWYSGMRKQFDQFLSHSWSFCTRQGKCFWVACGIVTDYQDEFVPSLSAG